MKKIGVLFGMENTFPGALVERINSMNLDGICAEFVQTGAVHLNRPPAYSVIVDRISHDIPFYRAFLKHAVLNGTIVINNPFWWSADDKFFNYALASKLGVAVPRTALLVVGGRQILQLFSGRQARRRRAADGDPAAQTLSRGHHRAFHAQSRISAQLGKRL